MRVRARARTNGAWALWPRTCYRPRASFWRRPGPSCAHALLPRSAPLVAGAGADDQAVRLQTGADRILDEEGVFLYDRDAEQRATLLDNARRALGSARYEQLVAVGRTIPIDQLADETAEVLQRTAASVKPKQEDET